MLLRKYKSTPNGAFSVHKIKLPHLCIRGLLGIDDRADSIESSVAWNMDPLVSMFAAT